jgi:hypothetical protein
MTDTRTHLALSRTSRLINAQFFAGRAEEAHISSALPNLVVSVKADARNSGSPSAQTAIVTLVSLLARMGLAVQCDCTDLPFATVQPPLRGTRLRSALIDIGADLIPGTQIAARIDGPAILEIAIGDTPCATPGALRLSGGDWDLELAPATAPGHPWEGELPFGALAGAATAAAEALRAAQEHLAQLIGVELSAEAHRLEIGQRITLDLRAYFPGPIATDIGAVDAISGGAITSAALYVLLRVPGLTGSLRVIERETLDLSNVNRYMLSSASLDGIAKTTMLAAYSTPGMPVTGVPLRYEESTAGAIGPLAPRVLVGVDDIPSRWLIQRHAPAWLGVGATQSLDALVSTHLPGAPCAGCLHGREPEAEDLIPTISFVSLWSGLLLALELLSEAGGGRPARQALYCSPFGYNGPHLMRLPLAPQAACPVGCAASRRQRAA